MTRHLRAGVFVLGEPKAPTAPMGTCKWCGETLSGKNAQRRNYCYEDREGRLCIREWRESRVWDTRIVVRYMARERGDAVLRCVDCGFVCERLDGNSIDARDWLSWEADHEVPLIDGGLHAKENLRCRCTTCHRAKTCREAKARARSGRRASPQLALV